MPVREPAVPSHFSTIGFDVQDEEGFVALAQDLAPQAECLSVKRGQYLHWQDPSGAELWLQLDKNGDLVGMNPHFAGKSEVQVGLQSRLDRKEDTDLDGALHGWAEPESGEADSGVYPFVFDLPDAGTYSDLKLPAHGTAQIAAFAHEVSIFESPEAYDAAQSSEEVKFASQSFIPSGLLTSGDTEEESRSAPSATAFFAGHIMEAETRTNARTGLPFRWLLVETLGGTFDVVVDADVLAQALPVGGVLSGSFWLSGRLTAYPKRPAGWLLRLLGEWRSPSR